MTRGMLFLTLAMLVVPSASAQTTDTKLALLIPSLYGPGGLVVNSEARLPDGSTHSAHFTSAFQAEFNQVNIALVSQLAAVPLPTPASGYTYTVDPTLGVFKRSTQSFGSILTERAETLGKGKLAFGVHFQRFSFDRLEGMDLKRVPAVFTHDGFQLGGGRADVVTTVNSIDARVGQVNTFFSYGLLDRLDLSVAVPIVTVDLKVVSDTTIQRIGTVDPATHFFRDERGGFGTARRFEAAGSASGIGDIVVRLKGTAPKSGPTGLALALDLRLPTGDEEDLLGVGAFGLRPLLAFSWTLGKVSPHVNLAYQWNGKSVLAGDVIAGRKGQLPNSFFYAAGVDVGLHDKVTLAVDILNQRIVDSPRLVSKTFIAANGAAFPQIDFRRGSFDATSVAFGVKVSGGGSLLLDVNLLVRLDNEGLRDGLTPLLGFEYSF